jgi:glycosyltransferase involved in cell wall biosynthesis
MPVISVIVPNFNHAPYLEQRIESILNQTFQDFELILLDDCSTDSSVEVLKRYAEHPKLSHLVINEQNSGSTFRQWDKGIALAKGEYVWIAESDDVADPFFLETISKFINNQTDIGLAYTQSRLIDSKGNVTYEPALEKVDPVRIVVQKNERIVSKGEVITGRQIEIINWLGYSDKGNIP